MHGKQAFADQKPHSTQRLHPDRILVKRIHLWLQYLGSVISQKKVNGTKTEFKALSLNQCAEIEAKKCTFSISLGYRMLNYYNMFLQSSQSVQWRTEGSSMGQGWRAFVCANEQVDSMTYGHLQPRVAMLLYLKTDNMDAWQPDGAEEAFLNFQSQKLL